MGKLLVCTLVLCALLALTMTVSAESIHPKGKVDKTFVKAVTEVKFVPNARGELVEKKIHRKQLMQRVIQKKLVEDPQDPSKKIEVEVPVEVAFQPNKRAKGKLNRLKNKLKALRQREKELGAAFRRAQSSSRVDWPVLEDGAPAKPDPQQVKMAEELYGELAATQFPKAKNIKEDDLVAAKTFADGAGAQHVANWDFFDEIKTKMLVPKHAWGSTM